MILTRLYEAQKFTLPCVLKQIVRGGGVSPKQQSEVLHPLCRLAMKPEMKAEARLLNPQGIKEVASKAVLMKRRRV